ncbi:MAG: gluzincin family metallopeptidase, partial [Myxococcaceae bacterium]
RFELALGRRVSWGFDNPGHQLKVAPHAFSDANAFYSRRDEAQLFGHFPASDGRTIFTCLSHDVIVHETSHALLDGLRARYVEPSSTDQAAFHEGFADVVALLSVFSLKELVQHVMDVGFEQSGKPTRAGKPADSISKEDASYARLRHSMVFAVGRELGREMSPIGRSALRFSVELEPEPRHLKERHSPHERGEVLVAAVVDAFIKVWADRLAPYFHDQKARYVSRERAAEEGARAADYLLTMVIRALDYCPPVHVEFGTFLSAMLTADEQIRPADPFGFRSHLRSSFRAYGIAPASTHKGSGAWGTFEPKRAISVDRVRFEAMQHDLDEVFRFAWENREQLELHDDAYTRIISVRRCLRIAPEDGFPLRETVAEVLQQVRLPARDLARYGVEQPKGLPDNTQIMLFGGVTLVFDEFGRLRFSIGDAVLNPEKPRVQDRQTERLQSLWERGAFRAGAGAARHFSSIHRLRSAAVPYFSAENW